MGFCSCAACQCPPGENVQYYHEGLFLRGVGLKLVSVCRTRVPELAAWMPRAGLGSFWHGSACHVEVGIEAFRLTLGEWKWCNVSVVV